MELAKRNFLKMAGLASIGAAVTLASARTGLAETVISDNYVQADAIHAPTGRSATFVIAASNSPAVSKAQADYVCDGTADDVEILAAFTAAPSGAEIVFLEGTYNLSTTVTVTGKNLSLKASGTVTVNCNQVTSEAPGLLFSGAAGLTTTITAEALVHADHVVFAAVTGCAVGDLVALYNTFVWSPDQPNTRAGELYKIKAIEGNNVYFEELLFRGYAPATCTVKTFHPVSIKLDGFRVIGTDPVGNMMGVRFRYATDSTIKNCFFDKNGYCSIALITCYNCLITENTIYNSKNAGQGYGVSIANTCANIMMADNNIIRCRHCVTVGWDGNLAGCNRDISIVGNRIVGSLDAHPECTNMSVTGNILWPEDAGISCGAQHLNFSGNTIFSMGAYPGAVTGRERLNVPRTFLIANNILDRGCIFSDTSQTPYDSLMVTNNIIIDGATATEMMGLYFAPGASAVKSIIIKDNNFNNVAYTALSLSLGTVTTPTTVNISGNNIIDSLRQGILLTMNAANANNISIQGNLITNPNMGNSNNFHGVSLTNVLYASISGNKIVDNNARGESGIYTGVGCDYNLIFGNTVKGCAGTKILLTGTNNTSEHNIEFA